VPEEIEYDATSSILSLHMHAGITNFFNEFTFDQDAVFESIVFFRN